MVSAILFDDHTVDLDARAFEMGMFWRGGVRNGLAVVWDEAMVRFVYERLKQVDAPVLFDVGAGVGAYSLLAGLIPALQVYAWEPCLQTYAVLVANRARMGSDAVRRIVCHARALGEVETESVLRIPPADNIGLATLGSPLRFVSCCTRRVKVKRLDDIGDIRPPTFVKIDVEGGELGVLRGGEHTLRTHRPEMLIEYNAVNMAQFGYKPHEITDLLAGWGATWKMVSEEDLWVRWT